MEPKGAGSNFELPGERQTPTPEEDSGQEQAVEAPAARPESAGNQPKQPALPAVPDDIPVADPPIIAAPPQDVTASVPAHPHASAADSDRIEHEWIDKVKDIVAKTQEDPHLQKEQVSRVKAEYIQKRFNKTIKTDEAAA